MNYAVIENGIIVNFVYLSPSNAEEYDNCVNVNDYSVNFGDEYIDGVFYHNGERVLSNIEKLRQAQETIAELDAALLEVTYQNIIGGLE